MASILKVDELRGIVSAGDITVTSEGGAATMQLQQGLAKSWVNFDGTTSGLTIRDSLSLSSLTDSGTGKYDTNYNSTFSNANYLIGHISNQVDGNDDANLRLGGIRKGGGVPTTSKTLIQGCDWFYVSTGTFADSNQVHVSIHGDLA